MDSRNRGIWIEILKKTNKYVVLRFSYFQYNYLYFSSKLNVFVYERENRFWNIPFLEIIILIYQ